MAVCVSSIQHLHTRPTTKLVNRCWVCSLLNRSLFSRKLDNLLLLRFSLGWLIFSFLALLPFVPLGNLGSVVSFQKELSRGRVDGLHLCTEVIGSLAISEVPFRNVSQSTHKVQNVELERVFDFSHNLRLFPVRSVGCKEV